MSRPRGKARRNTDAGVVRGPHASRLSHFENFTNSARGEVFLGEFALALQHELQHFPKVLLRFFEGLSLRNRCGNLFDEAGVSTFFGWFEYSGKLHGPRVSQSLIKPLRLEGAWLPPATRARTPLLIGPQFPFDLNLNSCIVFVTYFNSL